MLKYLLLFFREEKDELTKQLANIEKKMIVGGENLLEKAQEQEMLLEQSAQEIEERNKNYEELRKAYEEKEVRYGEE